MRAYSVSSVFLGMRQWATDSWSDLGSASRYRLGYLSSSNAQRAMGMKSAGRPWEGTQHCVLGPESSRMLPPT